MVAGAGDDADASEVGSTKAQAALQQVAALIHAAELENVGGEQLDGLRRSMEALERALFAGQ